MSTLSGIAAKGEKGKQRFQSLDINNIYAKNKGDPSETSQSKNPLSRRHGMQPLGKVPLARRPANLPSLKLEYSGNDPTISLVPSGGTGWGSKPGETGLPPTASQVPSTSTPPPPSVPIPTSAPATAAVTVSTPSTSTAVAPTTIPSQSHVDKSWSSITSNSSENNPIFLGHQSPYFQQEFPSLSGDANAPPGSGPNKIDPTHLPGPSLRPQNEGNWIQGGSRPQGQMGAGAGSQQGTVPAPGPLSLPHLPQGLDMGGGRSSLGPSGVGVGPAGPMPPHIPHHTYRLMPPFMLRQNMPAGGFPPNYQHAPPRPRFPYLPDTRFMPPNRGPPNVEQDEATTRPIIKEEDLKVMDEIGRDSGWAAHDEIDYNQTLSFSDEEGAQVDESKQKTGRQAMHSKEKRDMDHKSSETDSNSLDCDKLNQGGRQVEEDEALREKRRANHEEIAIAVERAKQRKEEEEKRFEESRQAANRKFEMLSEKLRLKNEPEKDETTTSPPLNTLHGPNALMPDWEKNKSRKNSEERDDKSSKENLERYRNTQMENRNQTRERENAGQPRQFSNNNKPLPPRFQKQAAENRSTSYHRQGSGNLSQPVTSGHHSIPYEGRWSTNFGGSGKHYRSQKSECDKNDNSRERDRSNYDSRFENMERERVSESLSRDRNSEENWKSSGYYEESSISATNSHTHDSASMTIPTHHSESDNFNIEKENDTFYNNKGSEKKANENFKPIHSFQDDPFVERDYSEDNKMETDMRDVAHKLDSRERLERPQRPDSRESRASKDSRNSRDSVREDKLLEENSNHDTRFKWSQSTHDADHKEEKRRKDFKDESETRRELHSMQTFQHQRHIPGPVTKEKLEASEPKSESSRNSNLVPLIKGELKKSENKWEMDKNSESSWSRAPAPAAQPASTETEWAVTTPHPKDASQESRSECQQLNIDQEETKVAVTKPVYNDQFETSSSHKSEVHRGGRGGGYRGMRHDSRGPRPSTGSYHRGGATMRRGQMPSNRRQNVGDWIQHDPESEASDDISASTESGKEDRRQDQDRKHLSRSPKRGVRKSDKDDRMRDSNRKQDNDKSSYSGNESRRYDKKMYEHNRMGAGFEPSGVPSRRGRGAAFRPKGSSTSLGRGMVDGYGPPTSKKPFSETMSSSSHEDKKSDGASQNQTAHKENGLNEMSHDDKMKLNQQQLSAGIIGNASRVGNLKSQGLPSRMQTKDSDRRERKPRDNLGWGGRNSMKGGSGSGDDDGETTSEHEDKSCGDEKQNESSRKNYNQEMSGRGNNWRQPFPRNYGRDKHNSSSYDRDNSRRSGNHQSMVNGNMRYQSNKEQSTAVDQKQHRPDQREKRNNLDRIDLNNTASVVVVDDQPEGTVEEDQTVFATDNNGFQEVRSKKNVKEGNRHLKEEPQRGPKERPKHSKPPSSQSPGPPGSAVPASKVVCDRTRRTKLAPRLAKAKEMTRQQKITQQQQTYDGSDLSKSNQVLDFPSKDITNPAPPPTVNAWDKPITATLRTSTPPTSGLAETCNIEGADHSHSASSSQRSSPNEDKAVIKLPRESVEKALLDGTSPPVQTIIFENTNYKAAPVDAAMKSKYSNQVNKNQRPDKPRDKKMEEDNIGGFKSPGLDIQLQEAQADSMQLPISFSKNEDSADMKLDFRFDSELSQLTEDKTSKCITSIQMARSIQMTSQSSAADLQFKLDAVKKVWEKPATMLDHSVEDTSGVAPAPSYTPTFGNPVEDSGGYGKPNDPSVGDENNTPEGVYNSGQQLQNNPNAYNGSSVPNMIKPDPSSNVCKVKPTPQSVMHPHAGPLSPPTGAFTSPAQPSQHINYQVCHMQAQPQYGGISAIPSPPTVFTQQHEQQLYQTYQLNNQQVLNSQARSQYSQYAPYMSQSLGQTSAFSQQSMYIHQTAQPPPSAATAPAHPDMFSQYRIQPQAYGANQQLSTNPNTMLISSSTVKPPPQPIGAIGSKAASYQAPSQPPSQLIIYQDPQMINQNYLQGSQLVQRPATNVVPTIPPSSASYYSASTGGNATGYFQPGNSNMHHLQAFSAQSPGGTPAGMGSFGSTFLSNGLQMAQQYRSTAPAYLKSPADHQDALSVFSSPATQTISPKPCSNGSGDGGKQSAVNCAPQQQPSPTQGYHKFTTFQQNVPTTAQLMIQQQQQRGSVSVRRYPGPIQRPVTFQPVGRHRPQNRYKLPPQTASAHYYITQNTKLVNMNMETKVEAVSKECEISTPASANSSTDTDNSTNID